ncbi:hypothetical protein AC1031_021720 [Aphanomyces cochlioides]|nr:hypothetical protein AC1031_021720 [Aphanomyces cochlioides]
MDVIVVADPSPSDTDMASSLEEDVDDASNASHHDASTNPLPTPTRVPFPRQRATPSKPRRFEPLPVTRSTKACDPANDPTTSDTCDEAWQDGVPTSEDVLMTSTTLPEESPSTTSIVSDGGLPGKTPLGSVPFENVLSTSDSGFSKTRSSTDVNMTTGQGRFENSPSLSEGPFSKNPPSDKSTLATGQDPIETSRSMSDGLFSKNHRARSGTIANNPVASVGHGNTQDQVTHGSFSKSNASEGQTCDSVHHGTGSGQDQASDARLSVGLTHDSDSHSVRQPSSQASPGSHLENISQSGGAQTPGRGQPNNRQAPNDVWAFQAQQRSQSAKAIKTKDVAPYQPTMEELEPLLRKRAAGTLTFEDTLPIQKHSARGIVGWLQMPTGAHTKTIDVSAAMASILFDNQALGLDTAIADIVRCEKDIPNRMLKWGVASHEAMTKLRGIAFKIQVARDGSSQHFTMNVPHVLGGFFMDIPQGLQDQDEERLIFDVMTKLEPRFLWGSYPNVSSSSGMASSRYRLYFEGTSVPTTIQRDGRLVEEILFKGRCLRVYGQGWYFRDKNLVRLDLDATSRQYGLNKPAPSPTNPPSSTPKAPKRRKTAQANPPQWTGVKASRGKRKKTQQQVDSPEHGRSWISPNMFEALDERVCVNPEEHVAQFGDYKISTIVPKLDVSDDPPHLPTSGQFVGGTKIQDGVPKRIEMSLDEILAELQDLDTKTAKVPLHLSTQVEDAVTNSSFNLAQLINDGRVDMLCSHLERSPIEFGLQLHRLFDEDRACFEYFVRQRLLHRWLRATWGGDKPFSQLYSLTWGVRMTREHVQAIFSNIELFKNIDFIDTTIDGDEISLHRGDLEEVLAVAEVLLAIHAPTYYNSDAAIVASTKYPVTALASHLGSRCLSGVSLSAILLDTSFGLLIWNIMETLYAGEDEKSRYVLTTILEFHEAGSLDPTFDNQMLRTQRLSRSVAKVVAAGLFTKFPILELTTANLNGLKDNGHLVARRLQIPTQAVFFQETKINNIKHLETFQLHLNNEVGVGKYKLFTNDLRTDRVDSLNNRRCGVASYFHGSMPGFLDLQHLTTHDRPGRYMVVRTQWDGVPVYFHNVYAPVIAHSRAPFFDDLPRDFEDDSIHFVGGDFNLPLEEHLDATRPRQDHNAGKAECIAWLSALGVIDAWRMHHPNERVYSGPPNQNPQTIVISSYNLSTCVEMGGTTFRLGGKDFLVPKYSRYGNNYYVTFNKVSHPSMAKAIVKKMAALTKSVIAAFNPTAGQNIKSPHLRVIFKSSAPPAVLVPKSGDALREITITDPSGQPFVVVFQHKIAALNKTLPPSIVSRRAEAKAEKAKAKAAKAAAKSPPSGEKEPEHDGDDHDQDPGTNAEGKADSTEASEDGQDEQPQPTAPSHGSDVDMSGDSDPPNNNGQDKQQEDVEMSTNESPALAPPSEQPKNSLDLQLVTGYRSGPAPKRTLPSSPRLDPLPTSNRFHILEEDDVELSFEDFAVPRIVLEDSSAPRPKKTKGKAKKQRLNKSAAAHLELAKKIIRDKKVEGSITECQRILRDDPQLVAHAMYAQDEDLSLFQSLVATKTIERKMALLKAQGKPHNYKHHVNFMAQYKIHPSEILEELTTDIPEIKRILFALATIDLFLSNRAPDLYTNSEALTVLLNQEATRLPDTNCLTDWSLFALIENFSDNLEKFTLPAPVLSAISMLKSITNNYHIDELCSKAHHSMNADEIDPLDLEDDQL